MRFLFYEIWPMLVQVCGFSDCKLYACFVVRLVAYVGLSFVYFFSILNSVLASGCLYYAELWHFFKLCVFLLIRFFCVFLRLMTGSEFCISLSCPPYP